MPPLALAGILAVGVGVSLGLLGGGGSILTLPILLYVLHLPEPEAIATSLVVVGITSAVATVPHARAGHVDLRTGLMFAASGTVGAFVGGWGAGFCPPKLLLAGFVAVMVVAGLAMIRGRGAEAAVPPGSVPRTLAAGLGAGVMTGLVGAGGGFVVVPALTLFGGLDVRRAVGTSLLVISLNTAAGFAGYALHARVDPVTTAVVTGAAVVGSVFGGAFSQRVPQQVLRRGFGVFVLCMAAFMVWKAV
jgi:uncharacterized membrane protein YfcA